MALIGYARVSTEGQDLEPQLRALREAGCTVLIEERASGADRGRPELARLLRRLCPGDAVVVVRLDRLARSLAHLPLCQDSCRSNRGRLSSTLRVSGRVAESHFVARTGRLVPGSG